MRGSSPTSSNAFGTLNGASRSRQWRRSAAASGAAPSRGDDERGDRLAPDRVRAGEDGRLGHARDARRARASTSAGATFSPPVMITSPLRPVTTSRPRSSSRPRSPVRSAAERVDGRPGDDDLAVARRPRRRRPGSGAARGLEVAGLGDRDRRAGLGQAVARADREAGGPGALRAARAASARRRAGSAAGPARAARRRRAAAAAGSGTSEASVIPASATRSARRRAPRSSPSAPSAGPPSGRRRARAAAGRASARRRRAPSRPPARARWRGCCRSVISTGRGRPVVPEVWTISAVASSGAGSGSWNTPDSPRSGRPIVSSTSRSSAVRSRSASRGSTGSDGRAEQQAAVERLHEREARARARAPTGSPRRTPRMCSAPAARTARSSSSR